MLPPPTFLAESARSEIPRRSVSQPPPQVVQISFVHEYAFQRLFSCTNVPERWHFRGFPIDLNTKSRCQCIFDVQTRFVQAQAFPFDSGRSAIREDMLKWCGSSSFVQKNNAVRVKSLRLEKKRCYCRSARMQTEGVRDLQRVGCQSRITCSNRYGRPLRFPRSHSY